LSIKSF
jgi:hypothetical protein